VQTIFGVSDHRESDCGAATNFVAALPPSRPSLRSRIQSGLQQIKNRRRFVPSLAQSSCREFQAPAQNLTLLRTAKAAALLWLLVLLQSSSLLAQENQEPPFPEGLRYVFDLPWCKAWQFACARCEKDSSGRVVCTKTDCTTNHEFFRCVDFAVDKQCARWTDGCNGCWWDRAGRATCTARNCFDYRPRFTCVAPDSRGQR
jgi:hypothetical protein